MRKMIGTMEISAFVQLYFSVVIIGVGMSKYNLVNGESMVNATRLKMFVDDLPNMPKLFGYEDVGGKLVSKSLTIGMFRKKWKFHRDLPPTDVFAYGTSKRSATVPGPTIEAHHGIDTYVMWENHLPLPHILPWDPTIPTAIPADKKGVPTVVHLHGSITEPESDGHASAWFTSAFKETGPKWTKKTYHYTNKQQPGNLWYHDHAMGLTRVNILAGLLGAYVIRQPKVESPLRLPYGDEFDHQLLIFDRSFYVNGSIYMNQTGNNPTIHPQWQPEYFGDVIVVNGKAWPYMNVRRRKYRFRIRNASNARFFRLYFTNGLDFVHVGSDSAYLNKPVVTNQTFIAPSEIADVIVDFSKSKSNTVILANNAPYPYPSGDPVNEANSKVMKFIINPKPEFDESRIPHKLLEYPHPNLSSAVRSRFITLYEYTSDIDEPTHLFINGLSFEDPVTETPVVGSSEVWYVINLTEDNHPLHIHFALFSVLEQVKLVKLEEFKKCMNKLNDAKRCNVNKHAVGQKIDVAAPERGWKNVYKMMPGFVTKLLVRFSYIHSNSSYPFDATAEPGYAYHCHILDHEDNVMMRPLKLVTH
ncbi:Multicopper oxidase lpr2 [Ancistrocladus abbreviatus]